jgi:hypothetical protein
VMEDSAHDQAQSLPSPTIMLATGPEAVGVEIISDARCLAMDGAGSVGERALLTPRGEPTQLVSLRVLSLRGVKKEIHLADGAECRARPESYRPQAAKGACARQQSL